MVVNNRFHFAKVPMRVAALYDIHGNLPALEAVLAELPRAGVTHVVVGGDVLPGPMPVEALDLLNQLSLPVHYLRGNGDREVLALKATGRSSVPEPYLSGMKWNADQLGPEHIAQISAWSENISVEMPVLGHVLFIHATPRNDTEVFTKLTPEEQLRPLFEGVSSSLVVCGHTHMQFDRRAGTVRVVNAGSVGMPFGPPGAYWLLLGPDVELRHTPYDLSRAAERIRATAYPGADAFALNNVIEPPEEQAMLIAFSDHHRRQPASESNHIRLQSSRT
jgi:putative phosphoesterase